MTFPLVGGRVGSGGEQHDRGTQAHKRWTGLAFIMALVVAGSGVGSLLGLPSWTVLLAASIPFITLAWARLGGALAAATVLVSGLVILLAVLVVTATLRLPLLATVEIVYCAAGLAGCAVLWRGSSRPRSITRSSVLQAVPSLAGSVVWFCAVVASRFIPGGSQLAWVMRGDSANNILLVRDLLRNDGVVLGSASTPVPLPSVVLAVLTASGRGSVDPQALLRHDVAALALCWVLLIALGCTIAGVAAGSFARAAGSGVLAGGVTSAAASLIPLTWFYTGYPIDFGFLDAEIAIPLLLVSLLAALADRRHFVVSLTVLLLDATLLLAVWSPLVLIPGLLILVVLRGSWREVRHLRGVSRWVLILASALLLGYGFAGVLPSLLALGHLLSAAGSVYNFHRIMVMALACLAVLLAVATRRRSQAPVLLATAGFVLGSAIALGVLLFVSRNQPSVWTYYPVKLAWLCSAAFVILVCGLLTGLLARLAERRFLRISLSGLAAVLVAAFLYWAPTAVPGYAASSAVSQVVKAHVMGSGDALANRIFHFASSKHGVILWHSGDPFEASVNFWLLENRANTLLRNTDLRLAAYGLYDHDDIHDLCRILGLMGHGSIVYSNLVGLQSKLDAECPGRGATVSREPGR